MITLISGGARGIGFATAQALIAKGHRIAILDRQGARDAASGLGTDRVLAFEGDVTNEADIDAAVTGTVEALGGLDCVVTCAGIVKVEPALEVSAADFADTLSVNVLGTFLTARRAARYWEAQGRPGSIVCIGSVYGEGGASQRTSYCASKGAVHNLARSLAVEWGPLGIRVNVVAPTGVRTPMLQRNIDQGRYNMTGVLNRTPLGRLAEPEEVAAAIAFLLSPEASMIHGAILPVDGGWTANGYTW